MSSAPHRSTRQLEAPDEELALGEVLVDRYRVLEVIGHGGMGVVYLGEHLAVGRRLAIKVLSRRWSYSPEIAGRFRAEARAATAAGHPNIVQVFDAGELPDGRLFLVMEYLQGWTVLDELNRIGAMPAERACRIGLHVARAIRAAHDRGVIHRDLKAENVMLVDHPDGEIVKVLDFGVAIGVDEASEERLTRPGLVVGTPETMAPEQAQGREPTVKFDIYGIGSLLFECLSGRPPFVADTPLLLVANKLKESAPPIGSLCPGLPRALEKLVDDCLRVDPADRPDTAADVCDALESIVRGLEAQPKLRIVEDLPVVPAVETERLTDPELDPAAMFRANQRRKVVLAVLAMAGAFAAIVGLAWGTMERGASESPVAHAQPSPVTIKSVVPPADPSEGTVASTVALNDEPKPATATTTTRRARPHPRRVGTTPSRAAEDDAGRNQDARSRRRDDSQECASIRNGAIEARQSHDWRGVLASTANKGCWPVARERKKLRVQALKELKQFSKCAQEAEGMSDPEVQTWATLCTRRAQVAGSPLAHSGR